MIVNMGKMVYGERKLTYFVWWIMKNRCYNPSSDHYPWYGARGIRVCDRWRFSFGNFVADMGYKKRGWSIERLNNLGNYEPGNCVWIPLSQQGHNRRSNINITFNGKTLILLEWCRLLNIDYNTAKARIYAHGWDKVRAITTPTRKEFRHG